MKILCSILGHKNDNNKPCVRCGMPMEKVQYEEQVKAELYNLEYHLAPGLKATVDNVSEKDLSKLESALSHPNRVISVSNKQNDRKQLIPVRNILAINIEAVK